MTTYKQQILEIMLGQTKQILVNNNFINSGYYLMMSTRKKNQPLNVMIKKTKNPDLNTDGKDISVWILNISYISKLFMYEMRQLIFQTILLSFFSSSRSVILLKLGSPYGLIAKVLNYSLKLSEFKL